MTLDEIKPFGDRLIVRPDEKVARVGSIVIPDVVKGDNPNWFTVTGIVLKLGDGIRDDLWKCQNRQCGREERRRVNERCSICGATAKLLATSERQPFPFAVGDRVTFNRFAGKQIEVERFAGASQWRDLERVLIVREVEVLGVVEGDHELLPGYEAPAWDQPTSNKGDNKGNYIDDSRVHESRIA